MDQRTINVKKNITLSLLYKGVHVVVQLALVPITLNYLDKDQFGIWLTLSAVLAWISFFDIGFGNGLRNKLAQALAFKDYGRARGYVSTVYAMLAAIFTLVFLVYVIVAPVLNWAVILNIPASKSVEVAQLAMAVMFFFCLKFIFGAVGNVLFALQEAGNNNLLSMWNGIVTLAAIFILSHIAKSSLFWVGVIYSGVPVLIYGLYGAILFGGRLKYLAPSIKYVNKDLVSDLFGLGYKFFVIQVASIVLFSSANVLVAHLYGPGDVTAYNIAFRYFSILVMIYGIVLSPLWSAFTDAYEKNDTSWIELTAAKLNKLSVFFILIAMFMFVVSDTVYDLWLSGQVVVDKSLSLAMAVFTVFTVYAMPYNSFINGVGKIELQFYSAIMSIILMVPLALFFSRYLNFGVSSIVVATLCTTIPCAILWKIQFHKIVKNKCQGVWGR
jgi:O-antigen/teichoic acid export membrane protein